MQIDYEESGRVKTVYVVKQVNFRKDGQVEIIPKRGKTKLKPAKDVLSITE